MGCEARISQHRCGCQLHGDHPIIHAAGREHLGALRYCRQRHGPIAHLAGAHLAIRELTEPERQLYLHQRGRWCDVDQHHHACAEQPVAHQHHPPVRDRWRPLPRHTPCGICAERCIALLDPMEQRPSCAHRQYGTGGALPGRQGPQCHRPRHLGKPFGVHQRTDGQLQRGQTHGDLLGTYRSVLRPQCLAGRRVQLELELPWRFTGHQHQPQSISGLRFTRKL